MKAITPEDRELTSRLYGGDSRIRIRQELLLGVGGFRALRAMGITPGVLHLNEGHSGFAVLEAIRSRMQDEGIELRPGRAPGFARSGLHHAHSGPRGPRPLQRRTDGGTSGPAARSSRHFARRGSWHWAARIPATQKILHDGLGLKLSRRANAVSALHGEVSRAMWTGLYPGKPEDEVPIGHITNGVHVPSWLAPQMFRLYDRHFGTGWQEHSGEPEIWEGIEKVDDGGALGNPPPA